MRNDAAGLHVLDTTLDAGDDVQLALDVAADRLSGEKGSGALGPLGEFAEALLELGGIRTVNVVFSMRLIPGCMRMCTL